MTHIALNIFKGMWPRRARQSLPPEGSELAENCDLFSGDLRALRRPALAIELSSPEPIKHAFRVPASFRDDVTDPPPASHRSDSDVWKTFEAEFAHFVRGPLVNDQYTRFYWTEEGQRPKYAALADLVTGGPNDGADPYYILGVPAPLHIEPDPEAEPPEAGDMFTVTAAGGTVDLKETRCYVYTFINIYGEESAPSLPVCAEGNGDGTWTIAGMKTAFEEPWASEGAPLDKKRIYRTITGSVGASFFFVAEIDAAETGYVDDIPTDEVSLNLQLQSDAWKPPPEDLVGILRHPNGFLVGFVKNGDLWFSVPYRPHAWPAETALSTEGDIQALGVYGQTVAVLTNAHPYAATGANPAGMTLIKSDSAAPCVSPYSVVSMEGGVAYASPDGIVVVAPGGLQVATERVVSRGEWRFRYDPATLRAVQFGSRYLAITMVEDTTYPRTGLIYSPKDETSTWSEVQFVNQQQFQCLQHDIYSGIPYTIYNNAVYWLGLMSSYPEVYQWKSTEFVTPRPVNFGAFRIDFDRIVRYPEQGPEDSDIIEQYGVWNQARIEEPLDTINNHPVNGVRQVQLDPPNDSIAQNRQAVGGSPLFFLSRVNQGDVAVLLYGGRVLRYAKVITEPGIYRLPIGYKSDLWQIEFRGTADVHHFKIAETGKELAGV